MIPCACSDRAAEPLDPTLTVRPQITVASKTLQTEGYALRAHIPPKLGHRPIASIHSADLDALYGNMLRSLARPTVMRFRNTLSSFFGWAERNRLVQKNIVLESRVPRGRGQDQHLEVFPFDLAGLWEHEWAGARAPCSERPRRSSTFHVNVTSQQNLL